MTAQRISTVFLGFVTFLSLAIGFYAVAFQLRLAGDLSFHVRFDEMPIASTMHVVGGAVVLLTGALQFWQGLRARYPVLHRSLGRIYLIFVLIGGIGGLILAPVSNGGVVAHFGFGILAVVWLFTGARAFHAIRCGKVQSHQEWMMRNFALTFAAVMLRIYLGLFAVADVAFEDAYPAVAWLCWVPNILIVEWFLVIRRERRQMASNPLTA